MNRKKHKASNKRILLSFLALFFLLFYGAVNVKSASAPVLDLDAVSSISRTSAFLKSYVTDPGGSEITDSGFEYGLTTSYGNSINVDESYGYYRSFGSIGVGNGQFDHPYGIALDSLGNSFVVDIGNNRIQKFDSSGIYVSQFGSFGSGNGQFSGPFGIAIDSSDNIFVTDPGNQRVQKFDSSGVYVSQFGSAGSGDGQFIGQIGIVIDSSDNIFVVDTQNDRVQKFDSSGAYVSQFGSTGSGDGQFSDPTHIAFDSSGNIFVTDLLNHRVQKFDSSGTYVSQFGSAGSGDGQLNQPVGIYIDQYDDIFVVDSLNRRVQKFDSSGTYLSKFGTLGGGNGQFLYPLGITVDETTGEFYITDYNSRNIEVFKLGFSTILSDLSCATDYSFRSFAENDDGVGYSSNDSFTTSDCILPEVETDLATNITKTTATLNGHHYSIIEALVGTRRGFEYGGTVSYGQSVDESSDIIDQINYSALNSGGIDFDSSGNMIVSDMENNRVQKFDSSGTYVSQFGSTGSSDGQFKMPIGVAVDSLDNIFVVDSNNGRVQKFDSSGTYVSQFGSAGSGDGKFKTPIGISIDSSDNIFITDSINNRVQKFDSSGTYVSQFGSAGSGDGQFDTPTSIAIDSSGNIFVTDSNNSRVQKFDSSGTYVSQFGSAGSGDGQFDTPTSIAIDSSDNIFVADSANDRVQKFDSSGTYLFDVGYSASPYAIAVDGNDYLHVGYPARLFKIKPDFSFNIASLSCNSTYHFRFFSENADGIGYGENQQFTTSSCGSNPGGGGGSNPNPVRGCTDSDANNYNPSATQDNGSCLYEPGAINGCTDETAGNYDDRATVDDGSCLYGVFGCMDLSATNYDPSAEYSNNSCVYAPIDPPSGPNDTPGCTNPSANNYNTGATQDNGSCEYDFNPTSGCTDASAQNFNPSANQDDGSCSYDQTNPPVNPGDPTNPNGGSGGNGGLNSLVNSVSGFIKDNPEILIPVSVVGVVSPYIPSILGNIAGIISIPIRIWNIIPTLLGFRRRKRPWGTVFDSVTKQPLDPVYVMLKDSFGKEISTSITDLDGRYGFQVPAGQYSIFANKANYTFPSVKLVGKTEDELYHDLYFGETLSVGRDGEVIQKNIPMDAQNFNWNEFEKSKNKKLMKFYSSTELFLARISKILFFAGLVASVLLTIIDPRTFNLIILGLYIVILVLAFFGIKPRASGFVREKGTGFPLSFGIISVFSAELGREVAHTIIGKTGKYYLLVPKGNYFLKIRKKTGEDSYEDLYQSESFVVKKGYINKVIKV